MNSDFSFKKFQWKNVIALALCLMMVLPSMSVFASGNSSSKDQMKLTIGVKRSLSGNADVEQYYGTAEGDAYSYEYTGKTIKPAITVEVIGSKNQVYKKLASKYYSVQYGTFNEDGKFSVKTPKNVGMYYAKITFKGKYDKVGVRYIQFEIRPQTVNLTGVKAKSGNKSATVSWKKQPKSNVSKYEVVWSKDADLKNEQRVDKVKNKRHQEAKNSASSTTIKKGKEYAGKRYVRVCAYKEVIYYDQFGNENEERIYGDWSKCKTVIFK